MCRYCFEIYQHADFGGDWSGWRLRGRELISPDGDRVSARRLRGMLTLAALSPKKRRQEGKVIRLPEPQATGQNVRLSTRQTA